MLGRIDNVTVLKRRIWKQNTLFDDADECRYKEEVRGRRRRGGEGEEEGGEGEEEERRELEKRRSATYRHQSRL